MCLDREGKQHGPGVAVFAGTDQAYEDAWSVHGVDHGTRWTWHRDGSLDAFARRRARREPDADTTAAIAARRRARDARSTALWMLEGPPPARDAALGRAP